MSRTWEAYGNPSTKSLTEDGNPTILHIYPRESLLRMCGIKRENYNKLILREDENGLYLGWLKTDSNGEIGLVQYHKSFAIQFPYGVQAAVDKGQGEAVRLSVDVIPN